MYANKYSCGGCCGGVGAGVNELLSEVMLCLVCCPLQAPHRGCSALKDRPEASVER